MTWFPPQRFGMVPAGVLRRGLSVGALATYTVLTTYANGQGYCSVGDSTLALNLGVNRRTAQRYLQELVEAGLLDRKQRQHRVPVTKLVPVEPSSHDRSVAPEASSHDISVAPEPPSHDTGVAQNRQEQEEQQTRAQKQHIERPAPAPDTPTEGDTVTPIPGRAPDRDDDPNADEFDTGRRRKGGPVVPNTSEWLHQEFAALCLEHLRTGHYNHTVFNVAVKTLRDTEGVSYAEVADMLPIWILRHPNLREKAREYDPAQLFRQEINSGLAARYRKHMAMGAAAPGEEPRGLVDPQELVARWRGTTTEEATP